jgi:SPP1 family predicted phage head-tail adaptor
MSKFKINAGKYRHPVIIQKLQTGQDSYGESTENWIDVIKVRAGVYPLSGREYLHTYNIPSDLSHKVQMRYVSTEITPDMRVMFNGRVFRIISVINFQEMNKELEFMCKEMI